MMLSIRPASLGDLEAINAVIEQAIMGWHLAERVKRLSLPSYFYNEVDLQHFEILIAEQDQKLVGVAAWEAADLSDTPQHQPALLLHGLYVLPGYQRQGIATQLLRRGIQAAQDRGLPGLLVKAQADAIAFFQKQGMQPLAVKDAARDYANRMWLEIEHQILPA